MSTIVNISSKKKYYFSIRSFIVHHFFWKKYFDSYEIFSTSTKLTGSLCAKIFPEKSFCILFRMRRRQGDLKGVFAKKERGYRLNAIKKRFWSLLILLPSVASIRRKLLKTSHTEERSGHTNWENFNILPRP